MKRSVQQARAKEKQQQFASVNTVQADYQFPIVSSEERNDYLFSLPDDIDAADSTEDVTPVKVIPTKYIWKMGDPDDEFDSLDSSIHVSIRGTIDTQAHVNVTPHLHVLHDVKFYDDKHPAPINLVAALDSNAKVAPIG